MRGTESTDENDLLFRRIGRLTGPGFVGLDAESVLLAGGAGSNGTRAPLDFKRAVSVHPASGLSGRRGQRTVRRDRPGFLVGVSAGCGYRGSARSAHHSGGPFSAPGIGRLPGIRGHSALSSVTRHLVRDPGGSNAAEDIAKRTATLCCRVCQSTRAGGGRRVSFPVERTLAFPGLTWSGEKLAPHGLARF